MISMRTLIHQFQALPTLPHVVLMVPPPLFVDGASGLSADIVADRLPDAVIRLAHQYGCSLVDLRMDENDLDCPATALAPLCKLRNLRTLSLSNNKLVALPPMIEKLVRLTELELQDNRLHLLPGGLKNLRQLKTLNLRNNSLVRHWDQNLSSPLH